MSPFDIPDIPQDLRLQWMQLTGSRTRDLRSLYTRYNMIHIPILDVRSFCRLAIAEARVAKDGDDLCQRAENVVDQQLKVLYSLMHRIYCDSHDPTQTSLSTDTAAYVHSACVSSSLQAMVEAICKMVYSRQGGPDDLQNNPHVELGGNDETDSNGDEESDFAPETQYLPAEYGIIDDDSSDEWYLGHGSRDVQELGDASLLPSPSARKRSPRETSLISPTSSTIEEPLPSDTPRTSVAETSPSHTSLGPSIPKHRSSCPSHAKRETIAHSEPVDNDTQGTKPESHLDGIESDGSNTEKSLEALPSPNSSPNHQSSKVTPENTSHNCNMASNTTIGSADHCRDSSRLNGKRKRRDEDGHSSLKRTRSE
ncbi:hypothetical protein MAC_04923 [Metarhizium acridum CQMa 102]|uniref:Uncharacterized protein n=1 Tax=Metarhizium acridum (strain CQMa 102) TaxID=655827 RepID=E9E4X5_METAQ|nr:uncharacterized protein MAC_04923 [Metarhizium acridum CQMa 102]EFY88992.1 hypothetical protein MAC_04923 [Metarhizium acridum CQMa 102]